MEKISNKISLNSDDNLKSNFDNNDKLECKRIVNSDNAILHWQYNKNGEPIFSVGEIINHKKGIYQILNTEIVINDAPFTKHSDSFTSQNEKRFKPRQNLCYCLMFYQFNEIAERKYALSDCKINIFGYKKNIYLFDLCYDSAKPNFKFIYVDKKNLFTKNYFLADLWLEFEKNVNTIYKRNLFLGKNFLAEDEEEITKCHEEEKQKWNEVVSRCNTMFTGKKNSPDNSSSECLFK